MTTLRAAEGGGRAGASPAAEVRRPGQASRASEANRTAAVLRAAEVKRVQRLLLAAAEAQRRRRRSADRPAGPARRPRPAEEAGFVTEWQGRALSGG